MLEGLHPDKLMFDHEENQVVAIEFSAQDEQRGGEKRSAMFPGAKKLVDQPDSSLLGVAFGGKPQHVLKKRPKKPAGQARVPRKHRFQTVQYGFRRGARLCQDAARSWAGLAGDCYPEMSRIDQRRQEHPCAVEDSGDMVANGRFSPEHDEPLGPN